MSTKANAYLVTVNLIGLGMAIISLSQWHLTDPLRFSCYLAIALLASGLKVTLPGINGSMSVSFFFIILGVMELSLPETVIIGCGATLIQSFWRVSKSPKLVQVAFNLANMVTAITAADYVYRHIAIAFFHNVPLMLVAAACTYFVLNTMPVAIVISLTENKPFRKLWSECYF